MRKKAIFLIMLIMCVFFLVIPIHAQDSYQKFNLKISGGYGTTTTGDVQAMTDGINDLLADAAALGGFTVTDTLENVKWGSEFEGEFVFNFSKKFGVGLGVEYIRRTNDSLGAIEFGALTRLSLSWEPVYTATPIKLSGYYRLPFGSNMNAYLKAGVGYYSAKIAYTIRNEEELLGIVVYEQQDGEAKDNGLGFHGGLGWEMRVAQNVAFFVEGTGRYVNLKDWDVENTTTSSSGKHFETGKFWHAEEYNPESGKFYASLFLFKEEPDDPGLRNARKAEISLSGLTMKLGVKVSF